MPATVESPTPSFQAPSCGPEPWPGPEWAIGNPSPPDVPPDQTGAHRGSHRAIPDPISPPDRRGRATGADRTGARLRELAGLVEHRDRTMGRAARLLVALQAADDLHDRLGGMTLQVWLEHVCRIPGPDARALLGVVDVLERLPSVLIGLCDRWLSWGQVQAICRAARRVRIVSLGELDDLVATAMVDMAGYEPDAIVADVWDWVDRHQPSRLEREHAARDRSDFLALQPRLTGGGSLYGELGATSFGIVAERLSPVEPPTAPVAAPLNADDLDADDLDSDAIDGLYDTLDEAARSHTRGHGAAMAQRLVALCAAGSTELDANGTHRPLVIATIDIDALCDATRTPGWLLHTLAGGRMQITASALQRLVDARGADLRGVILDDCGQVVGVGRRTHVPPTWLRHAIWARDLAVADPDGSCPIRRADLDHVTEWPDGATDVTNLHPVGRRWHNHKTTRTWTVTRADNGTTTWHHRRHGWTLRMAPPRRDLARPPRAGPPPNQGAPPRQQTAPPPPTSQPRLTGVP